jgi:integrase
MSEPKKLPRGITLPAPGLYRVRVHWHGQDVHIGNYSKLKYAEAALDRARLEMANKTFIPPGIERRRRKEREAAERENSTTVKMWSERWLDALRISEAAEGTITTYESALRTHVLDAIGFMRVTDVTTGHIQQILDGIGTKGARDNAHRVMRSMFSAAVKSKSVPLTFSPVADVDIPKTKTRNRDNETLDPEKYIEADEFHAIVSQMPLKLQAGPIIAYWCALRLGEVLGLQRRDFRNLDDLDRATVTIARQWNSKSHPPQYTDPKAGSVGTIPIPKAVLPLIIAHLDAYVGDSPKSAYIPSSDDPLRPLSHTTLDNRWRKARDQVKPGFRFHYLRHTALTNFGAMGTTTAENMAYGRHRDPKVAAKYQHARAARMREATARMGEP